MEKPQLINFIAKVMEDSGFKVYKNFKTSKRVIDIYAVLQTTMGDFGVVIACDNSNKEDEIGINILKETEDVANNLKASKVAVVTSAHFNNQATNYALRRNIKLVDRDTLLELAKKYQEKNMKEAKKSVIDEYPEYAYDASDMEYLMHRQNQDPIVYKNSLHPQNENYSPPNSRSLFNRNELPPQYPPTLYPVNVYNDYYNEPSWFYTLQPLLSNAFVAIALIVIVSYGLSYLLGTVLNIYSGISGLVEMIVALALSYGLTYIFADRSRFFITRGTIIFFISLIVLIILILIGNLI